MPRIRSLSGKVPIVRGTAAPETTRNVVSCWLAHNQTIRDRPSEVPSWPAPQHLWAAPRTRLSARPGVEPSGEPLGGPREADCTAASPRGRTSSGLWCSSGHKLQSLERFYRVYVDDRAQSV